jgi:CelD/BcsL family acetyltransferase involved in cellulose biosynthesis
VHAEVVDDARRLAEVRDEWDALAVAARRPYAAPGWLLPWWQEAAPSGSVLRTVLVRDARGLAGIAPFYAQRGPAGLVRYRTLGTHASSRVEPLARAGDEHEVAAAASSALAAAAPSPTMLLLDAIPASSSWPRLLTEEWPGGRVARIIDRAEAAPFLRLEAAGYEQWLARKGGHFRKRMRRARRELDERGASFRLATRESLDADLAAFARLHLARWAARGGSGVLKRGVEAMLRKAATELSPDGRLRLWLLEADGGPVAAELLVAAGGEAAFWLGGFDESWARAQPSLQTMLRAIEHAFEAEDERVDLGEGGQRFKDRLADGEERLEWVVLLPRGPRRPAARLSILAGKARRGASRRLAPRQKRLLKRLLRR